MIVSYIDKSIQDELENRRKALARESNSPLELGRPGGTKQFNKYLSRTPYVVMASNLKPAEFNVAIGGGSHFNPTQYTNPEKFLNDDKTRKSEGLPPLVNHMHGFRNDGTGAYRATKSKGISPIPGIKDISVEFKGGYKGIREATVNWAVSNLEDLEFYTPHFLAIGRSVALEWGWTMFDTPSTQKFITYGDSAIEVDDIIFTNPSKMIIANSGNLDGIGGVVTNFNFKLRDDGGFDCTTILSALGVNFFSGDGLDSSGESGPGSILAASNTVTGTTTNQQELISSGQLTGIELTNLLYPKATIIEELANLSHRLALTLDKQKDGGPWKITHVSTTPSATNTLTGTRKSKEKLMPYFQYFHRFKEGGHLKSDFMIRWGWFEDNIISKYTAATARGGRTLFNFRSIDGKGESIKISYHENLIPINPFRSMIFADSTNFKKTDLDGGDLNIQKALGDKSGTGDIYFDRYSKYFVSYFTLPARTSSEIEFFKPPAVKFNENGYGKLRNIYVSLSDILESFGFDPEYTSKLVKLISMTTGKPLTMSDFTMRKRVGGGSEIKVGGTSWGISIPTTYFANSDKITPPKTIENAINTLLKKINRNFHNYWKFSIATDTETMDNIRIVDENYVAPKINGGANQSIDYTTADENGIYKFPSFTIGSTVKSQTLEFKLPDAMKTVAMYGTNSPDMGTSADPSMKKFKALGAINKNPFIKGDSVGTHILSNLLKVSDRTHHSNSWFAYGNTHGSGSLTQNGNDLKGENTFKYVKMVEKAVTADSSDQSELIGSFDAVKGKGRKYVMDVKARNIVLKAEAVEFTRTKLGVSSTSKSKSYLIPADLGLEIDGIGGIKPGNICHTDYIQRIYNERKGEGGKLGPNTFFQIFGITQKVSGDGWTTSLDTTMRINGNALSATLDTSFADVLGMGFGTPVKERQQAKTQAEVHAAIDLYNAESETLMAEARAASLSDAELSRPDDAEMEGDLELEELDFEDDDPNLIPLPYTIPLPPEVPVTTAVTDPVEGELLKRDEPESTAVSVEEAAKAEAAEKAIKDAERVKDAEAAAASDAAVRAADARMNEEVNKITYKITLETVGMTDGNYWHKVEGTYTGDLSIDKTPFENKRYKFRSRTFAGNQAKSLVLAHFRRLLQPIVMEEFGA